MARNRRSNRRSRSRRSRTPLPTPPPPALPFLEQPALSWRDLLGIVLERHPASFAFGEADGRRMTIGERRFQHPLQLILVLGRHDDHMGHMTQVDDIVNPLVGGPIIRDDAGAVEGEDDGQVLERDIVVELVIGPLQDGGIDSHYRLWAAEGQAGRAIYS